MKVMNICVKIAFLRCPSIVEDSCKAASVHVSLFLLLVGSFSWWGRLLLCLSLKSHNDVLWCGVLEGSTRTNGFNLF